MTTPSQSLVLAYGTPSRAVSHTFQVKLTSCPLTIPDMPPVSGYSYPNGNRCWSGAITRHRAVRAVSQSEEDSSYATKVT